jgi:hypothetical protein
MRPGKFRPGTSGLVLFLVGTLLILGVIIVDDFGINWDESGDALYGRASLQAYRDPRIDWDAFGKDKYYGPAHYMFQQVVVDVAVEIAPLWDEVQGWHFANLLSFLVSIPAFYMLSRQFVSAPAALAAVVLFATQPLYFGHAFINGKDTPFMALFLLVLALGFRALDSLPTTPRPRAPTDDAAQQGVAQLAREAWRNASPLIRVALSTLIAGSLLALMDLLVTRWIFYYPFQAVVRAAYAHQAPGWLNDLFDRVAQQAGRLPLEAYLAKATVLTDRFLALAALVLLVGAILLIGWGLRALRREFWRQATDVSLRRWVRTGYLYWLLATGIVAGILNSVRPVGLLALFLVGLVTLRRQGARSLLPLMTLGLLAAVFCYLTWPYLWKDPLERFLDGIRFLAGNPNRDYVLYLGQATKGRLLPWHYLPLLMLMQFTEPLWVLALLGAVAVGLKRVPGWHRWEVGLLFAIWLLSPTVPLILAKAWFYDNFRQFLFVTPVFFLLAALGLEFVFTKIRASSLRYALVVLAIAPGILGILRLHPYEYVYYNALAGGTRGAARRFELDYWATSYSEAIRVLNETAPYGTTVAFLGTMAAAQPYAREDLKLLTYTFDQDPSSVPAQILVATTRANADIDLQRFTDRIGEVTVDSVPLAVIRHR